MLGLAVGSSSSGSVEAGEVGAVCVRDDAANVSCSGSDVAASGLVAVEVVEPCGSGAPDTALVVLDAVLAAGVSRQDVGIYLALTGGSALLDGVCYHDYLAPPISSDPVYGDANGNTIPDISGGPWYNAEPFDLVDDCGDIAGGTEAIPRFGSSTTPIEVACVDTDEDGLVDVDVCVTWSNGTNDHCTSLSSAVASTSSRCQCGRVAVIGLPEPRLPLALGLGAFLLLGLGTSGRKRSLPIDRARRCERSGRVLRAG